MAFLLQRYSYIDSLTYGRLYYEDIYICDTMEGKDLRLEDDVSSIASIVYSKKSEKPAIPRGKYRISNCYLNKYKAVVPCIYGVNCGFKWLVITDSSDFDLGCICVGIYDYGGRVFVPSHDILGRLVGILDEEVEMNLLIK